MVGIVQRSETLSMCKVSSSWLQNLVQGLYI